MLPFINYENRQCGLRATKTVMAAGGTAVGSSGSGTSAEEVNLTNPTAGTYTVVVDGWGVVGVARSPRADSAPRANCLRRLGERRANLRRTRALFDHRL